MKQIKFTDITLREAALGGEGALSSKEIIEAAKILDRLNVDVISLAPIINEKIDSLLVRTVAAAVKKSSLSVPVGFGEFGAEAAWNAVAEAAHPRLYVEAPTSAWLLVVFSNMKPD